MDKSPGYAVQPYYPQSELGPDYPFGTNKPTGPCSYLPRVYPKTLAGWLDGWWPTLQCERIVERPAYGQPWPTPPGLSGFSRMAGIWGGGPPALGRHRTSNRFVATYTYGFQSISSN